MPNALLDLNVSPRQLSYRPGGEPAAFGAIATNLSDRFASFQVALRAVGVREQPRGEWYRVEPEVSAKIPPGARFNFQALLLGEPIRERLALEQNENLASSGIVDIEVRVLSLDLEGGEARERIRLAIAPGDRAIPLGLKLPVREFEEAPGERFEIRVELENLGYQPTRARLELAGLPPAWLPDGTQQALILAPRQEAEVTFIGQLPSAQEVLGGTYPFVARATHTGGVASEAGGTVEVLPAGSLKLSRHPEAIELPSRRARLPWQRAATASTDRSIDQSIDISLENESNVTELARVSIEPPPDYTGTWEFEPSSEITVGPYATGRVRLTIRPQRNRLWRLRNFTFVIMAKAIERRVDWEQSELATVRVHPQIPLWLSLSSLFSLASLVYWLSWMNAASPIFFHNRAVNSVEFNERGTDVISGSNDSEIIEWDLAGFNWIFVNPQRQEIPVSDAGAGTEERGTGAEDKAVTVVRYRPLGNDRVAVGLENGVIQIWNLRQPGEKPAPERVFSYNRADRVFDLRFALDSQTLYSAHGRGTLIGWRLKAPTAAASPLVLLPACPSGSRAGLAELEQELASNPAIARARQFDFAIYSMIWVGEARNLLAVAGERNQLVLADGTLRRCQSIPYGSGGTRRDYITALTAAKSLLVSADNQGTISVWRVVTLNDASEAPARVTLVDRWRAGKPNSLSPAVRSLALSADACYLVSGGDDGRIVVWPLDTGGKRARDSGRQLFPWWWWDRLFRTAIASTDVTTSREMLRIVSGSSDTQVRVFKYRRPTGSPPGQCR